MNSKDLAIGVLSTTAVILFVGLIILNTQPTPVYASGMSDRGGDYILVTGAMWAQEELLYVINSAENKMMIYRFDTQTGQIKAHGPASLDQFFSGRPARLAPKGRRSRRRP